VLSESLQRELLESIKECDNRFSRAVALQQLIPYLSDSLLDLAITRVQEMDSSFDWADAVVALAPRMAELGHHQDALDAAGAIDWEQATAVGDKGSLRANALAGITPHLTVEERTGAISEAVPDALKVRDHYYRSRALAALLQHVPDSLPELRKQAARASLDAARNTSDPNKRGEALTALGPSLREPLLSEALAVAALLPKGPYLNFSVRAKALSALVPKLCDLPAGKRHQLWSTTLHTCATGIRPDFLWDVAAMAPLLKSIGGSQAVADAARTIFDIAALWP
jgi:hypothetical protein